MDRVVPTSNQDDLPWGLLPDRAWTAPAKTLVGVAGGGFALVLAAAVALMITADTEPPSKRELVEVTVGLPVDGATNGSGKKTNTGQQNTGSDSQTGSQGQAGDNNGTTGTPAIDWGTAKPLTPQMTQVPATWQPLVTQGPKTVLLLADAPTAGSMQGPLAQAIGAALSPDASALAEAELAIHANDPSGNEQAMATSPPTARLVAVRGPRLLWMNASPKPLTLDLAEQAEDWVHGLSLAEPTEGSVVMNLLDELAGKIGGDGLVIVTTRALPGRFAEWAASRQSQFNQPVDVVFVRPEDQPTIASVQQAVAAHLAVTPRQIMRHARSPLFALAPGQSPVVDGQTPADATADKAPYPMLGQAVTGPTVVLLMATEKMQPVHGQVVDALARSLSRPGPYPVGVAVKTGFEGPLHRVRALGLPGESMANGLVDQLKQLPPKANDGMWEALNQIIEQDAPAEVILITCETNTRTWQELGRLLDAKGGQLPRISVLQVNSANAKARGLTQQHDGRYDAVPADRLMRLATDTP